MNNFLFFKISILVLVFSAIIFSQPDLSQINLLSNQYNTSSSNNTGTDIFDYSGNSISPSLFSQKDQSLLKIQPNKSPTILESSIDPNSYLLGPNDEISIYLWGTVNQSFKLLINSEGLLLIPSVGVVELNKCSLADAKIKIRELLLKVYKKAEITISLSSLRIFPVYVTGDVKNPGVYNVDCQTRVLELINFAGGLLKQKDIRLRGIRITNDSNPEKFADIAAVLHSSKNTKNYFLTQGDRVIVSPRSEFVEINGHVNYPGSYDFVDGDNLIDIINAAGGLYRGADSNKIILSRFEDNNSSFINISLTISDSLFKIKPDDRILICGIPDYRKHNQIEIEGEVKWPGVYPIIKGKTKLSEIIKSCGGFTQNADLNCSKIIRSKAQNYDVLKKAFIPDQLTSIEQSFIKSQIVETENTISLPLSKLINSSDIILENQDRIVVSQISRSVQVAGRVKYPGIIEFEDGKNVLHYIDKAGGFTSNARKNKIRILRNNVMIMLKPDDIDSLNAGDIIFVPELINSQVVKNFVTIITIISSSISMVGTIVVLSRNS